MKTSTKTKEVKPLGKMVYGAPELKTLYQKYAFRGLITAIIFTFVIIGSVIIYNSTKAVEDNVPDIEPIVIDLFDVPKAPPVVEELPPPDEQKAPETVALKDLSALVPEPVAKNESEVLTTKTQDKLNEINVPIDKEGTENPGEVTWNDNGKVDPIKIDDKVIKEEPVKPVKEIFTSFEVEKAPSAVNLSSVKGLIKYPEIARQSGIEGTCVAKILVGTNGEIIKVASISGPDVFHNEIEDKISGLQFTPALMGGEPVKCYVNVPFNFKLNK